MGPFFRMVCIVLLIIVFLKPSNAYLSNNNNRDRAQHLTINKSKIFSNFKDATFKEVDINFDGLIDLIAIYSWGGSEILINQGKGLYYRVIQSNGRLRLERGQNNHMVYLSVNGDGWWLSDRTTIIDSQIYQPNFLPFEFKNQDPLLGLIRYDGYGYKFPFDYCKGLEIYAPRYRFDYEMRDGNEKNTIFKVYNIYEIIQGKYEIAHDKSEAFRYGGMYFCELNKDGFLDVILEYQDIAGSGAQTYAGLLLNNHDDSFVFSGEIVVGPAGINIPFFKTQKIKVDGTYFTAIVYKYPMIEIESGEEIIPLTISREYYDLYIYHPVYKTFKHIAAKPGRDKSTFIPIEKYNKQFEIFKNQSLLLDQ
ncbi:MAG: hypothetical protein GX661_02305 [Acholeplasmataceae bacterium]|nr:hypothetical protein [Acholeplasmataceae bacterium]